MLDQPLHSNETLARTKIDALLKDANWNVSDGVAVQVEYVLPDQSRADYVLCDRAGRPLAVIEAKRKGVKLISAQEQGVGYAKKLDVPYVFLSDGEEVWVLDHTVDAYPRRVSTFYSQNDLTKKVAQKTVRKVLSTVPIDLSIAGRSYQVECIDKLSSEISKGNRKLLVEMATGTGKTRATIALIKRLFQAGQISRVLFLVDRTTLAIQAQDAFVEHLQDYPCQLLGPTNHFDHAKSVIVTTLQTMIQKYRSVSAGYFDLVVIDECHRSIYGKWKIILNHFDGIQIGLTATPCTVDLHRGGGGWNQRMDCSSEIRSSSLEWINQHTAMECHRGLVRESLQNSTFIVLRL